MLLCYLQVAQERIVGRKLIRKKYKDKRLMKFQAQYAYDVPFFESLQQLLALSCSDKVGFRLHFLFI